MLYSFLNFKPSVIRRATPALALLVLSACGGSGSSNDGVDIDLDGNASSSDFIAAEDSRPAVIVRVTEDMSVEAGAAFDISALVMLASTPTSIPELTWRVLDPNADVSFESPDQSRTSMVVNSEGVYEVELMVKVGEHQGSDSLIVTAVDPIINQAPIVNAGNSLNLDFNETLQLNGTVDDDGLPAASVSTEWSFSSIAGNATFGELTDLSTQVTFDFPGTYTLTLTAFDGELEASDSLTVTVAEPANANQSGDVDANERWQNVSTSNGSKPQARHEAGAVVFNNDMYLLGGRGKRLVNRYDPASRKWTTEGSASTDFSHFQPVVYNNKIYAVGGLTCCYPRESLVTHVQIFNPSSKKWEQGDAIPANRRRGGNGAVVYKNKIYIVGGNTNGHDGGAVNWLDEYDPANNTWKTLKGAPNKRDHVNAVVVGDRLIVAGGRRTDFPNTFNDVVRDVDVYNFKTGQWETNHPDILTATAGAMTVAVGNEAIVIGGEVGNSGMALKTVQAYNVVTRSWRHLKTLNTARHSGGAAVVGNAIHVVSGNTTRGGGNETQSHEKLELD